MAKDEYDLLVIGSGAAGSSAVTTVAKNGRRVQRDGAYKRLTVRCGKSTTEELVVDEILLAVGRRPSFDSLNLEEAGVKTTSKGIVVDATLRTTVSHIWAAGDVASEYQFTHFASKQGELAASNAFAP